MLRAKLALVTATAAVLLLGSVGLAGFQPVDFKVYVQPQDRPQEDPYYHDDGGSYDRDGSGNESLREHQQRERENLREHQQGEHQRREREDLREHQQREHQDEGQTFYFGR